MGREGGCFIVLVKVFGVLFCVKFLLGFFREDFIVFYSNVVVFFYLFYCEGFGNLFVEVMVCGCFVVMSNCLVMLEVIGDVVLLVDLSDL